MTIVLSQQMTDRLLEVAQRNGKDLNTVDEALLSAALDWEAQERAEIIAGIQRDEVAAAEGREHSLEEFITVQRTKHDFASAWPQNTPETQDLDDAA